MSVTDYIPNTENGCRYRALELKNALYLVSSEHVKNIRIDNGEAYIEGLTEAPTKLEGWSIAFDESSSLDERYKFTKTAKITVDGKRGLAHLGDKYYVIFETKDGTMWMMNPDFEAKATYTYTLTDSRNDTQFVLSTVSNFPSLKVATAFDKGEEACKNYRNDGIKSLKMIESNFTAIDTKNGIVYTYGKDYNKVEFLKNTFTQTEAYDGNRVTTTITFGIDFDSYKYSWHYNLLEFINNKYAAISETKSGNYVFSGYHFGLQPQFSAAIKEEGTPDVITVTLTEVSDMGGFLLSSYTEEEDTRFRWIYVKTVGNVIGWECVGMNRAKYLLQAEVDSLGNHTGRYKCLEGYENDFPDLNIVGTFTTEQLFTNPECKNTICKVRTNLPASITFKEERCYSYSYSASCDWYATSACDNVTVSPTSGYAGETYTIDICATSLEPSATRCDVDFISGDNERNVRVYFSDENCVVSPSVMAVSCLKQNVTFTFDSNCPVEVTSISPRLTYTILDSYMTVNLPKNTQTSGVTEWRIGVRDCDGQTCTAIIYQDHIYERWVDTKGIICDGSTSYKRLQRYTGTSETNINTPTSEYTIGAKILDNDSRCSNYDTRWIFKGHYYCINGNKFEAIEEEIKYEGGEWMTTGHTRLGDMVEENSAWCEIEPEYEWRISIDWRCFEDI